MCTHNHSDWCKQIKMRAIRFLAARHSVILIRYQNTVFCGVSEDPFIKQIIILILNWLLKSNLSLSMPWIVHTTQFKWWLWQPNYNLLSNENCILILLNRVIIVFIICNFGLFIGFATSFFPSLDFFAILPTVIVHSDFLTTSGILLYFFQFYFWHCRIVDKLANQKKMWQSWKKTHFL